MRRLLPLLVVVALGAPHLRAADPVPLDPRGLPGPLVIGGSTAKLPTDIRDAFLALDKSKEPAIVVISTDPKVGNTAVDYWNQRTPNVAELLSTTDRKKADEAAFVKPLTRATAVWLEGADAAQFLKAYSGTAVETELKKAHARGVVVGCAADCSAVFGDRVGKETGFGILPGFALGSRTQTDSALKENPAHVGFAFAGGAGIVIRGRVARVIGDEPVTVCVAKGAGKPAANDEYKAGSLLDLCQLQRAALNRAAKEPFPPAKPPVAEVAKGSLVIVGGGGAGPEIWKKFIDLAGGPDSTIVGCVLRVSQSKAG